MADGGDDAYEAARDRTAYWTLSLYIDSHRLFGPAITDGAEPAPLFAGLTYSPAPFAALQARSPVTRVLRDSIEPLFNDIADREWLEGTHDFLFAAGPADAALRGTAGPDLAERARACARAPVEVVLQAPSEVSWTTEGVRFVSRPRGLDRPRGAKLRRFWFLQNNGAVTYNLSFALRYEHTPADYHFLSMLQKLAAPKEFSLDDAARGAEAFATPLSATQLGITPLDAITVASDETPEPRRFWRFVESVFDSDACAFFGDVAEALGVAKPAPDATTLNNLVARPPIIEVPGLALPKNRYMFLIRDEGFFGRLIPPLNPATQVRYPRKMMVQDKCFRPYARRLAEAVRDGGATVALDDDYWEWVRTRPDDPEYLTMTDEELAAYRIGTEVDGRRYHIPSMERGRADCVDYLFLSGFNQNIIDFMNQDTSEILDSLDPIYPKSDEQMDERFFVRFANHRGMITYVPRSRSLEVGNDYIGTCPYAFLIHAHAMHNEFLARRQEKRSFVKLQAIENALDRLRDEGNPVPDEYRRLGIAINDLKMGFSRDYERYRHANAFRYDTERDVFDELEKLRGTERKQQALQRAIADLEDHARDLEHVQQRADDEREELRDRSLNVVLALLGVLGLVQMLFVLADFLEKHKAALLPVPGAELIARWAGVVLGNVAALLAAIALVTLGILLAPLISWTWRERRRIGGFFRDLPERLSRSLERSDRD